MDNFNENSHLNAEGKPVWYMSKEGYRIRNDYRSWYTKVSTYVLAGVIVALIATISVSVSKSGR